ncbi:MAG TPA: carboxypeptidase-like regulatory domain-containing protein [Gemmatimonadaceae bacterium]|nr:carboxypeptidase-like regulatory domain-containing protein [Gemmatimonadaceae bacterium]
MRPFSRTALAALVALLLPAVASAQQERIVVRVLDPQTKPIPYALVTLRDGVSRVADDSGMVVFNEAPKDSMRLVARRIGYDPFGGWVTRSEVTGEFAIALRILPRSIQAVQITERANTPLGRSGFYDRVQRVQRGAYSARMITPEELEIRNPIRLTQMLQGENLVRVQRFDMNRSMLTGRGGTCGMTILLDGMRVSGTLEELLENRTNPPPVSTLTSIDDLVTAQSIAAIEIYASVASIPAELQRTAGNVQCGLVAIWTGSRR